MSKVFDVKASAEFAGVRVSALYAHIRNGRLPTTTVRGKFYINETDLTKLYPASDAGKRQKVGLNTISALSKDTVSSLEKMLQEAIAAKNYKVVSSIATTLQAARVAP